jgi:hypothetical protein
MNLERTATLMLVALTGVGALFEVLIWAGVSPSYLPQYYQFGELGLLLVIVALGVLLLRKRYQRRLSPRLYGLPDRIEDGVRSYFTRDNLPSLAHVFRKATSICILGTSSLSITSSSMGIISREVRRGADVRFLMLDPKSRFVMKQEISVGIKDARGDIEQSLRFLCEERQRLGESAREKLRILTYDADNPHSIIIVNREDDSEAWIQVENYIIGGDPEVRPNRIAKRNDSKEFFQQYLEAFEKFEDISHVYRCPPP